MIRAIAATALLAISSLTAAETRFELGAANLSGRFSGGAVVSLYERTEKWDLGIMWVDDQEVSPQWERDRGYFDPVHVGRNLGIFAKRQFTILDIEDRWQFKLGIGAAYWQNTNRALGANFTVPVSLEVPLPLDQHVIFGKSMERVRLTLSFHHFSNAGSSTPNMGQDAVVLGFSLREKK